MPEPSIDDAVMAPGHDGQAVLVVRVRHVNDAIDTVTLDADQARRLLESCAAETLADLRGQPWQRLLFTLERPQPTGAAPDTFSTDIPSTSRSTTEPR